MAQTTKYGCVRKMFQIPEALNTKLEEVAAIERRSQTQVFMQALEAYFRNVALDHPQLDDHPNLDPTQVQMRFGYGLGMAAK